jgi:hypothetical protein
VDICSEPNHNFNISRGVPLPARRKGTSAVVSIFYIQSSLVLGKKVMPTVVSILLIVLVTTPSNARYATQGIGNESCAQFASQYQLSTHSETLYFEWAQGFMSGLNTEKLYEGHLTTQDLSSIPVEQQRSFLRTYCDEHPLTDYSKGVLELYMQLAPDQVPAR